MLRFTIIIASFVFVLHDPSMAIEPPKCQLLKKEGTGYSLGGGLGVKTPIGPLRLDVASKDLSGDWRYTLGVGWKF